MRRRFFRRVFILIPLLTITSFIPLSLSSQTNEKIDVIKVSTDLVVFDVRVIDKKTRNDLSDLTKDDFEIFDRSVKQQITYFSRDELPLSILLLLDVSRSVRPVIHKIRNGAVEALQHLKHTDEVALMAFATSTELVQDFTIDRDLVAKKIEEATAGERLGTQTNFALALDAAATKMLDVPHSSRNVIVVITDNQLATSSFQKNLILPTLFMGGSTVYGLTIDAGNFPAGLLGGFSLGIDTYVEQTGGEIVNTHSQNVAEKLTMLIDHLRLRYAIGFRPSDTTESDKFRPVEVRIIQAPKNDKKSIVLTKRGYYFRRRS